MKKLVAVGAVAVGIIASAAAQDITIDSFDHGGSLSFWGARIGTTATVEWAASLTDAGRTNWYGLTNFVVTANSHTEDVPMFYRVRGQPDTNMMNGLVAYYPFNGNANDESGNGYNGSLAGNYSFTTNSLSGDALSIVGTATEQYAGGGHVILPDMSSSISNEFTLSIWAKDDDCPIAGEDYISFGMEWTPQYFVHIQQWNTVSESNFVRFVVGNQDAAAILDTPNKPPSFFRNWKHLVLVKTPTTLSGYVNGQKLGETSSTATVSFASYGAIGRTWWASGSSARLTATLDEARIYNRALSPNEVQRVFTMNGPSLNVGLVAYYPFNGNANDESGNGNNGAIIGAVPTQNRFSVSNAAFAFDGLSNKISVAETPGFEQNSFTLSIWLNAARFNPFGQARSDVISKGFAFQWVLQLEAAGRVRNAIFTSTGQKTFDSTNTITTDAWYHIAKVWDGSTSSTYINGVFDSSMPAGGVLVAGDDPVIIGGGDNFLQKFQGKLDDVRIYNRALSSNEVFQLYQLPY